MTESPKLPDYKPLKDLVSRIVGRLEEHPNARTSAFSVNRDSIEDAARMAQMDFEVAVDAIERRTACECRPHSQVPDVMMCIRDDTQLLMKLAALPHATLATEDGHRKVTDDAGNQVGSGPTLRQAIRSIRKPNPTTKEEARDE